MATQPVVEREFEETGLLPDRDATVSLQPREAEAMYFPCLGTSRSISALQNRS
jgi:hypothetical protein